MVGFLPSSKFLTEARALSPPAIISSIPRMGLQADRVGSLPYLAQREMERAGARPLGERPARSGQLRGRGRRCSEGAEGTAR
jgi:hypothetical protein